MATHDPLNAPRCGVTTRALPGSDRPPPAAPIRQPPASASGGAEHDAHPLRQPGEGVVPTRHGNPTAGLRADFEQALEAA